MMSLNSSRVIANFVLKFPNFCYHDNWGRSQKIFLVRCIGQTIIMLFIKCNMAVSSELLMTHDIVIYVSVETTLYVSL